MSAPTLKELIGKARKPTVATTAEQMPDAFASGHARQELARRCSPATLLAVYEALELAEKRLGAIHSTHAEKKCRAALNLLNATES